MIELISGEPLQYKTHQMINHSCRARIKDRDISIVQRPSSPICIVLDPSQRCLHLLMISPSPIHHAFWGSLLYRASSPCAPAGRSQFQKVNDTCDNELREGSEVLMQPWLLLLLGGLMEWRMQAHCQSQYLDVLRTMYDLYQSGQR